MAKGAWTLRQLQFKVPKRPAVNGSILSRWCGDGLGQHRPKLVYYKEQVDIQLYTAMVTKYTYGMYLNLGHLYKVQIY